LSRAEQKKFRSRMSQYRRRRKDLKPEEETELNALFEAIPALELPYCFREDIAEIFDTACDRQEASARLEELREVVIEEPELQEFFALYDRWQVAFWPTSSDGKPVRLWKA
jgi:hypothetical protein